MLVISFVSAFPRIFFFLFLGELSRCLCVHVNQSIEITSEENRRLGLQLTPSLEIISIAIDSLVAKQASLDATGGGIRVGDRISGINGVLLDDKQEQTIDYFTSTISKLEVPYTIEFEFAPRKIQSQSSTTMSSSSSSLSLYKMELHVRLVNNIHSVVSKENDLHITAYMSEDTYDVKQDVFDCKYTPMIVADPMNACASVVRMAGSNGQLEGAFAVVSRGICAFEAKVEHAKFAGASGVIVINQDDNVFSIPKPPDRGQQRSHNNINIPIIMVTKSDGELLLEKIIGNVHNTLSATSHGFEVRGHEIGNTAEGKMLVKSVCDDIEESENIVEKEEERKHIQKVRHRFQFSRERRFVQQEIGETTNNADEQQASIIASSTKSEITKPVEVIAEGAVVDYDEQFELEYNKLKALPPAVFKNARKSKMLFNQIQATFKFNMDQMQSIRSLLFPEESNRRDEL